MLTIIKILNQIGGVGVILTVGGSFIKYNSKKGWKCRKNASNREKFFFLFLYRKVLKSENIGYNE